MRATSKRFAGCSPTSQRIAEVKINECWNCG
jgi:hypothetical protein